MHPHKWVMCFLFKLVMQKQSFLYPPVVNPKRFGNAIYRGVLWVNKPPYTTYTHTHTVHTLSLSFSLFSLGGSAMLGADEDRSECEQKGRR